jgi:Zn-dependent M28 family amino/carboxypeptidase
VLSAAVPSHPDTPRTRRPHAYDSNAPEILPQVAVGAEHYNLILRLLRKGKQVRIEMDLDVKYFREDSGYNVIAEIPGTDLRDELVMIGAHLDSWHGGTGTTDNGTGVASCMEATRILKLLDLKPRRTIRIALWGGEEQGVLGSRAYVKRHFGERADSSDDSTGAGIRLKPEGEKFSVYFNNDNGTGKIRGVYMEGNEAVRPIFREWLDPFEELGASTLTLRSTGSTDHIAFNAIGLPGFQFIQDPVEYWSRTWHSTMDVFDRALEDDLKQASVIMAAFAYNAAMRDEPIPRKPPDTPERRRRPGRTLTPGD